MRLDGLPRLHGQGGPGAGDSDLFFSSREGTRGCSPPVHPHGFVCGGLQGPLGARLGCQNSTGPVKMAGSVQGSPTLIATTGPAGRLQAPCRVVFPRTWERDENPVSRRSSFGQRDGGAPTEEGTRQDRDDRQRRDEAAGAGGRSSAAVGIAVLLLTSGRRPGELKGEG